MENGIIHINHISERDIDLLIIEEFISNTEFAGLFLSKVGIFEFEVIEVFHSLVDVNLGESDITIIIKSKNQNIAILIEDKIDAIAMPNQYSRYTERADKGIINGQYDKYYIFIAAPAIYIESNLEAKKYDNQIPYEILLKYFLGNSGARSKYKSTLLKTAIKKRESGYIPIEDISITAFWQNYYEFKRIHYSYLSLNEVTGPRGSRAVWPEFKTNHSNVKVIHKSNKGYVDLTL